MSSAAAISKSWIRWLLGTLGIPPGGHFCNSHIFFYQSPDLLLKPNAKPPKLDAKADLVLIRVAPHGDTSLGHESGATLYLEDTGSVMYRVFHPFSFLSRTDRSIHGSLANPSRHLDKLRRA